MLGITENIAGRVEEHGTDSNGRLTWLSYQHEKEKDVIDISI